ncbi:MAG: SGNH/GDSL hydrolase family protein [Pedobacter sp.]|nr:SGNH/GDSL hydrolase family protein [Pedobacter sp.]MDQ8052226.1 SGNH/GDSL hydrolase family protein [Pedobacter sp.]
MKKGIFIFFMVLHVHAFAQVNEQLKWWNPKTSSFAVIGGQEWPKEVGSFYDRFPARAQKLVRQEVWALSRNAAGLKIRFKTNANHIKVRYLVAAKSYAMDHFPATGRSGVDLYAANADGTWAWAPGKYKFADTITYDFNNLTLDKSNYRDGRTYTLFLPLYNTVNWLEIGVEEGATFVALPPDQQKPIVVYGTSIAQGGCASRPGMAWTAILERNLHTPVTNLAFSGNGRLEKEVVDLVNEIDASIFVLDCLPNLNASSDSTALVVKNKIIAAVKILRAKHTNTPILLTEHSGFTENRMNISTSAGIRALNTASRQAYAALQKEGVKGVYVLPADQVDMGTDGTVDGTHPSDLGMLRYAQGYEKILKKILNK